MPVTDRIRSFISKAREVCHHPNSRSELRHMIMGPLFQKAIAADKDMLRAIQADGWDVAIRRYLKSVPNGEEGEETLQRMQADFWPATVRRIILDIDRARVYVPSRMEYVPLMPETITRAEIREAGNYLISKGEECIKIGERLLSLYAEWEGVAEPQLAD